MVPLSVMFLRKTDWTIAYQKKKKKYKLQNTGNVYIYIYI